MIDFNNLPKAEYKDCPDCRQRFRGFQEEDRCVECQFYVDHPEMAPKYWTWTKRGQTWTVVATWPDREPSPEVGDTITVHRKNGTTSVETISEIDGLIYRPDGKGRLHCWVQ